MTVDDVAVVLADAYVTGVDDDALDDVILWMELTTFTDMLSVFETFPLSMLPLDSWLVFSSITESFFVLLR